MPLVDCPSPERNIPAVREMRWCWPSWRGLLESKRFSVQDGDWRLSFKQAPANSSQRKPEISKGPTGAVRSAQLCPVASGRCDSLLRGLSLTSHGARVACLMSASCCGDPSSQDSTLKPHGRCPLSAFSTRHRLESFDPASGRKVPHPQPLKPHE